MGSIFFEITIIICLASILAILFRTLRQPAILAYILTGILLGPFALLHIHNKVVISNFSDLGVTLVLFLLGLELKFGELKSTGKAAILGGISQIVLTALFGGLLGLLFGLSLLSAFYVGVALAFSSTIVVVKLLADKKDINSLHGRISVGILLVQDFFAILLLIILSGYHPNAHFSDLATELAIIFLKAIIVLTVVINLSRSVLPKIISTISRSSETLFLFSIAWVFGVSALVASPWIGFSIEIGGFLAGLSLANAVENFQIVARVRPLRDFFVTIFFVFLGMQFGFHGVTSILFPAIILSLFVLVVKPLITIFLMGVLGYRKRTSFLIGLNLGQVSEFSLILLVLGYSLGHVSSHVVSLITLVAIICFACSPYLIGGSNMLYKKVAKSIGIFEWGQGKEEKLGTENRFENHIILVGATRMGTTILATLENDTDHLVVVDFDPEVVKRLQAKGIESVFGDISDAEIQERANLAKARVIVSTLTDLDDNIALIKAAHHANKRTKIIVMAYDPDEAKQLYDEGADYVVLPHIAGGRQIARTVKTEEFDKLEELREKDKKYLK